MILKPKNKRKNEVRKIIKNREEEPRDCRRKNVTGKNNEKIKEGIIERSTTNDQERKETEGMTKI